MERDSIYTRAKAREVADDLVNFLKANIKNTHPPQSNWNKQNFRLLRKFTKINEAKSYPARTGTKRAKQFMWDFIADLDGKGILLAAESEWDNRDAALKYDFQKLFYVRSPVKLMMCRVKTQQQAKHIKNMFERLMKRACAWFGGGEVYILYCVWWALKDGRNRDIPYTLQCNGDLEYIPITTERFELFRSE